MEQRSFIKAHGLGNDFVIIDKRLPENFSLQLSDSQICKMSDRKLGIGFDQLIVLEPSTKADAKMHIFNSNAGQVEACGNATRCIASYIYMQTQNKTPKIETVNRLLKSTVYHEHDVEVEMDKGKIIKTFDYKDLGQVVWVDVGNPHLIKFIEQKPTQDFYAKAEEVTKDLANFPQGINLTFAYKHAHGIDIITCERGVGYTQACGTASCATAFASGKIGETNVKMPLGDLKINVTLEGDITMRGDCVVGNFIGIFREQDYV